MIAVNADLFTVNIHVMLAEGICKLKRSDGSIYFSGFTCLGTNAKGHCFKLFGNAFGIALDLLGFVGTLLLSFSKHLTIAFSGNGGKAARNEKVAGIAV